MRLDGGFFRLFGFLRTEIEARRGLNIAVADGLLLFVSWQVGMKRWPRSMTDQRTRITRPEWWQIRHFS